MSYGGAGDSLEVGRDQGTKGGSGEKLWIGQFEGDCWGVVNGLAGEYQEKNGDVNLDAVRLSEERNLQYCLDQLELVKAMAVDLSVPIEVARVKADFLLRFISVVVPVRVDLKRNLDWQTEVYEGYIRIRQELMRVNTIINLRQLEAGGEMGVWWK